MAASVSEKPEWMHKTTTAVMKRPIQLRNRGCKEHQRTFCYMALGYQQISAWDCAPPSSRFSSPTPPPVLALLYIVLSAGGLSAGGQPKNPRHRPDEQGRPSQEGASGFQCPRVTAAPPRFCRTEGTDGGPESSHVQLLGRGDDVEEERCARLRSKDTWTCAEGGAGPALRC